MGGHKLRWRVTVGHADCPAWRRWVVPIPILGWSIRLHVFTPGHHDLDDHSHPWWFWTLVLRGSYVDSSGTLYAEQDRLFAGDVRFRPGEHVHRVRIAPEGCTTIILTGRFGRDWGFWTPDGYMDHESYRASHWHETICER